MAPSGVTTGFLDLTLDAERVVRIVPGTLGEIDCDELDGTNRCAVFADMLGDAVVWFAILPQAPRATVELPPIIDLDDGRAVFDNGWRIPYAPVIERECEGEDIPTFSDFLRRFGPTASRSSISRPARSPPCAAASPTTADGRRPAPQPLIAWAAARPELWAASTRGPSKASPASTIGAAVGDPARVGPRRARRGEAPLLHLGLEHRGLAEPRLGELEQRWRASVSRSSSQCASLHVADACTVIAGVALTPLAWLSATKLMLGCRTLDAAGWRDRRGPVERGQQRDRAVVVGPHQRLVEVDSRVGEERERLRERRRDDHRVGVVHGAVVDHDLPRRAVSAPGRMPNAMVEHRTSRPVARSFASEFMPEVADVARVAVVGREPVRPDRGESTLDPVVDLALERGRPHGEELGAVVERGVADATGGEPPADRASLVDQHDIDVGVDETSPGDEPTDPGADDDDAHQQVYCRQPASAASSWSCSARRSW